MNRMAASNPEHYEQDFDRMLDQADARRKDRLILEAEAAREQDKEVAS